MTKQHPDTKAYRRLYAQRIISKLTPELERIYKADIKKLVFKAERINFAQALLGAKPGRIVQIVNECRAKGLLD